MLGFLALCYHELLASITFILVMLDSITCWVGHVLRDMTAVDYRVLLICVVPLPLVG